MKKILFLSAVSLMTLTLKSHAATFPDWASNGPSLIGAKNGIAPLDSNGHLSTPVVGDITQAIMSTSGQTASDVAIKVNGAVQARGGDASDTLATSTGAHATTSLANRFAAGGISIKDYCGDINIGNQTGDAACVQDAVNSVGQGKILEFYGNTVWAKSLAPDMANSTLDFVMFDGYVINPTGILDNSTGETYNDIIPNVDIFYTGTNFAPDSPVLQRHATKDFSYTPVFTFQGVNDGPSSNQQGSTVLKTVAISTENSSGNMNGFRPYLRSGGYNYAGSFDVNTWSSTQSYGTNWTWANIEEMANAVPFYCPPDSSGSGGLCVEYDLNELDMNIMGPEKPEAAYNPSRASRHVFGAGGGWSAVNIDNGTHVAWTASHPYFQNQIIVVKNSSGKPYMFYALHINKPSNDPGYGFVGSISGSTLTVTSTTHPITTGFIISSQHIHREVQIVSQLSGTAGDVGTYQIADVLLGQAATNMTVSSENMNEAAANPWASSGTTEPTWTFNTGDTITDNTIVWTCLGPFVADTGSVFKYSGGNDPADGYVARFGTLMTTDTLWCYNALIDFSTAEFDPSNPYNVDMRVKPDTYFDFSDQATAATQNLHLLGFVSADNALEYKVNGAVTFKFNDNGSFQPVTLSYNSLPSSPITGSHIFCSDCYSKLREDGDTATGILVYWNGTRWNDVLGLAVQH